MSTIISKTLRCGTPLIVERMEGVRSAGFSWLLPGGCAYDPPHLQGMSAMWSELLLRGAGNLPSREQADAFDRLGVSRGTDVGTYSLRISGALLGERVADALPLLVEMVLRPRMDYDAIDPARDLSLQALESLRDEPQERAATILREKHHPDPIGRSGMGTAEGLAAIEREDLVPAWMRSCRPEQSIIAFAGAVDPDAIEKQLNDLLGTWGGSTPEPATGATPVRGYHHEPDTTNQVQVLIAHDAPAEPAQDSLLEIFVQAVLSGGMSGRLFSEVREKRGLCYSVHAGYRGDRDYGVVTSYVGTTPERAQESLKVLWGELLRIGTPSGAVTAEEFQRAKVGMKSALVFAGESTSARAAALASDQRKLGRPRSLEEMAGKIDAVTLDEVNAYLGRRSVGTATVLTLGPVPLVNPAG